MPLMSNEGGRKEIYDAYVCMMLFEFDFSPVQSIRLHAKWLHWHVAQADIPNLCRFNSLLQRLRRAPVHPICASCQVAHDLASRPGLEGERFNQRVMILAIVSNSDKCCVDSSRMKGQAGHAVSICAKSYIKQHQTAASSCLCINLKRGANTLASWH